MGYFIVIKSIQYFVSVCEPDLINANTAAGSNSFPNLLFYPMGLNIQMV